MDIQGISGLNRMTSIMEMGNTMEQANVVGAVAPSTPFQQFLDWAVSSLNEASILEVQGDAAVTNYIKKQGSLEDAVYSLNEAQMAVNLATQIVTTSVSTFKEIQQMQV